ncbi:MAG: ABC transporter permease [Verrucomicrobia bacterium]|nr:ABC transporter permease [Verrucomicrobiota bacterium]
MTRPLLLFCFFAACTQPLSGQAGVSPAADDPSYDTLAIQHRGRIKPFFAFTQEITASLTGRTRVTAPEIGRLGSRQFVLSLWQQPEGWDDQPVILVDNAALRKEIGLKGPDRFFSFRRLTGIPALARLAEEADVARASGGSASVPPLASAAQTVRTRLAILSSLLSGEAFRMVPPPLGSRPEAAWAPVAFSSAESIRGMQTQGQFSSAKLRAEAFYFSFHPFRWAWGLWLLSAISLLTLGRPAPDLARRLGWSFALAGFLLLVGGIALRVWLAGRPPVTNMYESILWVSFGTALFALVFSLRHRSQAYLLAASPVVILALIASDLQPAVLDPAMNPLVPVLRSNFWLTVHVLTVTLSYGAFALASALGHFLVLLALRKNSPLSNGDPGVVHLYRSLQIGILLLATGVILGGVWANYSWGRFWDWDPKETWSLVALLSYLVLLHGRLAGWWTGYGLAVGSIAGFLTILMAWYGVNFVLGKGLHSYGFGSGGQSYVAAFALAELAFLAFALLRRPRAALFRAPASTSS